MRRVAAVLAALGLVALAVLVRDRGEEAEDTAAADPDAPIVCADDLADACRAAGLDVVEEVAGDTADRLLTEDGELGGRAWITTSAWARLVVDERARLGFDPVVEVAGATVAGSPVVVTAWADALDELRDRCPGEVAWRCLAEQEGSPLSDGNRVRVGIPSVGTALGLVVATSQAADLVGSPDFATNDFELGDFRLLAPRLAAGQQATPLSSMRTRGPGQVTAVGAVEAAARDVTSGFGEIATTLPLVEAVAEVVVVVPTGDEAPGEVVDGLAEALAEAGWAVGAPPTGRDLLPGGSVLAALRTLWSEAG